MNVDVNVKRGKGKKRVLAYDRMVARVADETAGERRGEMLVASSRDKDVLLNAPMCERDEMVANHASMCERDTENRVRSAEPRGRESISLPLSLSLSDAW